MEHLFSLFITVQVMAVTKVSSCHKDAVGAPLKGLQDEPRIYPSRAHHTDNSYIGGILKTADACEIGG
jgi:hypothetical protein